MSDIRIPIARLENGTPRPLADAAAQNDDAYTAAALAEAARLFAAGYNCAQSVAGVFWREMGLSQQKALALSAGYGGGFARLREMCGAAAGMTMVIAGAMQPEDASPTRKGEVYVEVQHGLLDFEKANGSLICRQLLGLADGQRDDPLPPPGSTHNPACLNYIQNAVRLTCAWMTAHRTQQTDTPALLDAAWYEAHRPHRPADGHKGTFGRVLAVCGSTRFRGAAALCCEGALRAGAGLVQLAAPAAVCAAVAARLPEVTFLPLDAATPAENAAMAAQTLESADALVIGCGLGRDETAAALVAAAAGPRTKPAVIDADALDLLAAVPMTLQLSPTPPAPRILTPHVGEMARLLACTPQQVAADLPAAARRAADITGAVVVLKSSRTVIAAPDGRSLLLDMPNSGLAKGGSGDVLAGIAAGLLAQGLSAFDAAGCAVWQHAAAARRAADRRGEAAMLPTDLLAQL